MADLDSDLAFAHALADDADRVTMARFLAVDLQVQTKPDLTPVSDADRAVEAAVRARVAAERPGDAVVGEEFGVAPGSGSDRRWVVDPVDGTKNFVRGVPVWATLLALEADGALQVAVVSAPALGRRWWASRGGGAWAGATGAEAPEAGAGGAPPAARRCRVSAVTDLADAALSYSSLFSWDRVGRLPGFLALARAAWRTRAFGDFYSYVLVAEGAVDVAAEPEVSLWDLAPLQLLVEEAGGRFTDLAGVARPDGGSAVATNGHLHETVLGLLAEQG